MNKCKAVTYLWCGGSVVAAHTCSRQPNRLCCCAVVHCCSSDVVIWPQLQHQFLIRASRRHNEGSSTCCSIEYNNYYNVNNDMIKLYIFIYKSDFSILVPHVEVSKCKVNCPPTPHQLQQQRGNVTSHLAPQPLQTLIHLFGVVNQQSFSSQLAAELSWMLVLAGLVWYGPTCVMRMRRQLQKWKWNICLRSRPGSPNVVCQSVV